MAATIGTAKTTADHPPTTQSGSAVPGPVSVADRLVGELRVIEAVGRLLSTSAVLAGPDARCLADSIAHRSHRVADELGTLLRQLG